MLGSGAEVVVTLHHAVAGGVASRGATEDIVRILTLRDLGCAAMIRHAGEQVAVFLVALRQRHAVGFLTLKKSTLCARAHNATLSK